MVSKPFYVDPASLFDMQLSNNYKRMGQSKELVPVLVSKYIPLTHLRTFSMYIDPFAKWRVGTFLSTPANRFRKKRILHALQTRGYFVSRTRDGSSVLYPAFSPRQETSYSWTTKSQYGLTNMYPHFDTFDDTTAKTRPVSSPFGTMKRFKILSESSPARMHSSYTKGRSYATGYGGLNVERSDQYDRWGMTGSSAYFTENDINGLRNSAFSTIDAEFAKSAARAMQGTLPAYRPFTFGRSLIELKDLPRSIITLRDSMRSISDIYNSLGKIREIVFNVNANLKQVPKEYLSYHFGWKQMFEDLMKLLVSPERVARRFNYLQKRAGKDTTFRYSMKYPLPALTGPGFWYDMIVEYEWDRKTSTTHTREIEFRAMSSLYFDFPNVALPVLRETRYKDMLGLSLRPTDLYKVMPWSWLYDWFTSLGSYIDLIDTVNRDRTTINYGFLTAILRGEIHTNYQFNYRTMHEDCIQSWGGSWSRDLYGSFNHESVLKYECAERRNAATLGLPTLRQISAKSNLTTYQTSILAALLAARVR